MKYKKYSLKFKKKSLSLIDHNLNDIDFYAVKIKKTDLKAKYIKFILPTKVGTVPNVMILKLKTVLFS